MSEKQHDISKGPKQLKEHAFKPGVSGNPAGRPKGKTLKEFARDWYMNKTEEEKIKYIEKIEKAKPGFAWQMAEGNPSTNQDITSNGETINIIMPTEVVERLDDRTTQKAEGSNQE